MVELRAPNNPHDFKYIAGKTPGINPKVFQGFRIALANPAESQTPSRPIMDARLSRTGHTVSYACPWCGLRHRHRADARVKAGEVTSRAQHCTTWRRLNPSAVLDSVLIRLAGGRA